jgi:acetyl esterase/lipase
VDPFLETVSALPPDYEIAPGLTVAEFVAFYGDHHVPRGAVYDAGVTYGRAGAGGRPLHMHLCRRADAAERAPGVVFVHGGGWSQGDPYLHVRHILELAVRGYVGAAISFRQSGEAPWPAALQDAKCAVRWLRANAESLGLDPDRIAVAGGSSGGHLAALVAMTPGRFEGTGGTSDGRSDVGAAVLWYPPTDLQAVVDRATSVPPEIAAFLRDTGPERLAEASPVTYVRPGLPPVLTMIGDADELVALADVQAFHALLDAAGVPNELEVYGGVGHSFDLRPMYWHRCFDRMLRFLDAQL